MPSEETHALKDDVSPLDSRAAAADLAVIRSMMEAGRKRMCIDGIHMIIWGGLLGTAFLLQYLVVIQVLPRWNLEIWLPVFVVGWAASFWFGRHGDKEEAAGNIAVIAYASSWFGIGVTATLYFITTSVSDASSGLGISIVTSAMFASTYFIVSRVTGLKILMIPSVGWWAIMVYLVQLKSVQPEILVLLTTAAYLLILAPGLYLRRLAVKEGAA